MPEALVVDGTNERWAENVWSPRSGAVERRPEEKAEEEEEKEEEEPARGEEDKDLPDKKSTACSKVVVVDADEDCISTAVSIGDEDGSLDERLEDLELFQILELRGQPFRLQRHIWCKQRTRDLWQMYMLLRTPFCKSRWPRQIFRGVALLVDPLALDKRRFEDTIVEENGLDTLRLLFQRAYQTP